jgi:hypothetical protein
MNMTTKELHDLNEALAHSLDSKNTMFIDEFQEYAPMFRESTDKTTEAYHRICQKWRFRVSLYDPVKIVSRSGKVVLTLPPSYNRVDTITNLKLHDLALNKFNNALANNHPLRTDTEEALDLFTTAIDMSQDKDRLDKASAEFAKLSEQAGVLPPADVSAEDFLKDVKWS